MIYFLKGIISSLFPQRCAYCAKVIPSDTLVCGECKNNLPRVEGVICPKCGREKDNCSCKGAETYYTSLAAPFYYSERVRSGLHYFKFRKYSQNAEAYAAELSATVSKRFKGVEFDFITEVPMTRKSLKKRGYNQCALLAEKLSEKTGIDYKSNILKKLYETEKQHTLSFYLRRGNLTGVFDVSDKMTAEGKTILIVDDISTSGETLNECAKMLWLNGAKETYCVSVALTKHDKTKK